MRLIKGIMWVVLVVVLVGVIGWVGLTVWSCAMDSPTTGQPGVPKVDEASHSVYIKNTGNLLLTNDYEVLGEGIGSRVFTLHGFWEMRGQEFVYKDCDILLDERIFGEITIKRR